MRHKSSFAHNIIFRKNLMYLGLIGVFAGTTIYFFLRSDFFLVRHISVQSANSQFVLTGNIEQVVSSSLAKSIWAIDQNSLEDDLAKSFLPIQTVDVVKVFPRTLKVTYSEWEAVVILELGTDSYVASREGLVFASLGPRFDLDIPRIKVDNVVNEDERASLIGRVVEKANILKAIEIASYDWGQLNVLPNEILLEDGRFVVVCSELTVILSSTRVVDDQLGDLVVILRNAASQGKKVSNVDLRFEQAVVRYF